MNNTTRRNLLAKLGLGAAAIAALSVGGISQTAQAGEDLIPIDIKRSVMITAPANSMQVTVSIAPPAGGVTLTTKVADAPLIGFTKDGKSLNLGVTVQGDKVTIQGLDTLVNRAAASGRCTISTGDIDLALKTKAI